MARARYNLPSGYTSAQAGVTLEWGSAVINEIGLSVDGGDDSRIVIGADGFYQIYAQAVWEGISGLSLLGGPLIRILIDGATDYPGIGGEGHNGGTNSLDPFTYYGRGGQTALIYLTAGQYFQVSTQFGGATTANVVTVGASAYTHVTVRRLTSVDGALTYLTANEAGASNTTFNWDAEAYDSGSIWTSGPTHVAPSGPSKVSACANWLVTGLGVEWGSRILVNGTPAARSFKSAGSGTPYSSFDSGPLAISAGDTIAADITSNDATFSHVANSTSLATEFHSDDSIRLGLTSDLTTINAETSGPYAIGWTSVTEDSIGLFNAGTPTRIPLPEGWVKAGAVIAPSAFGINDTTQIRISHYNSSNTLLETWLSDMFISTRTDLRPPVLTGEIEASAGDYLVVAIEAEGDTSISILTGSYVWVRAYADSGLPLGPAASTIDLDAEADDFELVIGLSGSATVSLDAEADLFTAIGLSGASQITLDAEADLQLGTVLLGSAEITLDAAADLGVGTPLGLTTATLSLLGSGDLTVETRLAGITTVTLDAEADLVLGTDLGDTDATLNIFAREAGGAARAGAFFLLF